MMKNPNLPDLCYSVNLTTNAVIILENGTRGYYPSKVPPCTYDEAEAIATEHNELLGVSPAERKAMELGSMFGWNTPGADASLF